MTFFSLDLKWKKKTMLDFHTSDSTDKELFHDVMLFPLIVLIYLGIFDVICPPKEKGGKKEGENEGKNKIALLFNLGY